MCLREIVFARGLGAAAAAQDQATCRGETEQAERGRLGDLGGIELDIIDAHPVATRGDGGVVVDAAQLDVVVEAGSDLGIDTGESERWGGEVEVERSGIHVHLGSD